MFSKKVKLPVPQLKGLHDKYNDRLPDKELFESSSQATVNLAPAVSLDESLDDAIHDLINA